MPINTVPTLTLDIGTRTGWAIIKTADNSKITDHKLLLSGTWLLADHKSLQAQRMAGYERTNDVRYAQLSANLEGHVQCYSIMRIVFEDVQFCRSQMQAQLWASLRAAIWAIAQQYGMMQIEAVPVGTLKKFATGSGSADKLEMAKALSNYYPGSKIVERDGDVILCQEDGTMMDDNEVDAIWLARYTASADRGERAFLTTYDRKHAKHPGKK
jgi:Holliday junction resolvasome RuvABC endonuclease subunit